MFDKFIEFVHLCICVILDWGWYWVWVSVFQSEGEAFKKLELKFRPKRGLFGFLIRNLCFTMAGIWVGQDVSLQLNRSDSRPGPQNYGIEPGGAVQLMSDVLWNLFQREVACLLAGLLVYVLAFYFCFFLQVLFSSMNLGTSRCRKMCASKIESPLKVPWLSMKLRQMASRAAATGRRWVATPMGPGVPSGGSDGILLMAEIRLTSWGW